LRNTNVLYDRYGWVLMKLNRSVFKPFETDRVIEIDMNEQRHENRNEFMKVSGPLLF